MIKISTLFKKDPSDLGKVINEYNPDNIWAFDAIATRKFDGTACAIIGGELYKRYDAKKGKEAPEGAIPCQEKDPITGHHPHWVKVTANDKYHLEAFHGQEDSTYELCGEKVQSNPEKIKGHELIKHGLEVLDISDRSFEGIRKYLESYDIEGIIFYNSDGRMCKIRKSDFGIKR